MFAAGWVGYTFRFGVVDDVLEPVFTLLLLAVSFGVLCVTILHLLHVAVLVEHSFPHPWHTMISHPVCCLMGLILISV